MAGPIEIIGLVHVGITSACSLISTIKEVSTNFRSLVPLLDEAESKARKVDELLSSLSEQRCVQNLDSKFFQCTLEEAESVQSELSNARDDIRNNRTITRILLVNKLTLRLEKVNDSLSLLIRDLKLVGMFGEMLSKVVGLSQNHIYEAINHALNSRVDERSASALIAEISNAEKLGMETIGVQNPTDVLLGSEDKSLLHYLTGRAYYEGEPGISQNFELASQHMLASYQQGRPQAAHYLGEMSFNGQGLEQSFKKAYDYWIVSAGVGNADSFFLLQRCYWYGVGTEANLEKAMECTNLAASLGSPKGMRGQGYALLYGTQGTSQDWPRAVQLLERARLGGEVRAYMELGRCYEHGIVFERDTKKAFECWKIAHDNGLAMATIYVARCYEKGIGVEKDLVQAAELYCQATIPSVGVHAIDRSRNISYYGMCLVRGLGVQQNRKLGLRLIKKGLRENHGIGWSVLGDCYRFGYGVEADIGKAVSCYIRGSEAFDGSDGILASMFSLAEMYETGEGLTCDIHQAARYYQMAANRMHPVAQWKTGLFYESGKAGLQVNVHRSLDYFEKASRSGHTLASRKAGEIYTKGIGIQRDYSKGKLYIRNAVERGDDNALRLLRSERVWRLFRFRIFGLKRRNTV